MLESVYEAAICYELDLAGIKYKRQQGVEVNYEDVKLDLRLTDTRLGMLVNFNLELIKNGISRIVNNL